MKRDVAVVSWASFETPSEPARNEVELLLPVIQEALGNVALTQQDIGFTVSGSSDYLQGFPFAFVGALDAVGAWPPIRESHVEMDGAFALYEALGVRDLTSSPSTVAAAKGAGVGEVDAAWLHTPYPHQALVLREALGLAHQPVDAKAGPMMVGGLERLAAAAAGVAGGRARRAVAHATSGACLQQNLVALLEGEAA